MATAIDLVARLRAYEAGRAMRIASHRQVAVRPGALVIATLAMAGEDTTVHAVTCGRLGQPAEFCFVPDPRVRDEQYRLFEWLSQRIEPYFGACELAGQYPQIWVSSTSAVQQLDTLADRLRFNRTNVVVRRLGELLTYATERAPIAGQQALQAATIALSLHWATGQQPAEDEHLGALLTWIDPPAGVPVLDAVAAAERTPMGIKTDPEFDRALLEPRVKAYNVARRSGASAAALGRLAAPIGDALEPVVLAIYMAVQGAVQLLLGAGLLELGELSALERREAEAFEGFMASRAAGYHLPLRDSARAAVYKLTEREDATETVRAAVLGGDRVAQAQARLDGTILMGRVQNPRTARVGPRQTEYRFELESRQPVLRVRRRDELRLLSDPRLSVLVTELRRTAGTTTVSLLVRSGQRAVGLPVAGAQLELGSGLPDWGQLVRKRGQLKRRLAVTPWTHEAAGIPAARARAGAPSDLLAAVEALR